MNKLKIALLTSAALLSFQASATPTLTIGDIKVNDALITTPSAAGGGNFVIGEDNAVITGTNGSANQVIKIQNEGDLSVLGKTIEFSSQGSQTITAFSGSKIQIGNSGTQSVDITNTATSGIGVLSHNYIPGNEIGNDKTSSVTINATNVSINAAYGIWAQSGTEDENNFPDNHSRIIINAENTTITSSEVAILAFSNSKVDINSNLTISAPTAIDTRGHSIININASGEHTVNIKGDVVFETPAATAGSGSIIDSQILINLSNSQSKWEGSIYRYHVPTLTDDQKQVTGLQLTLSNGGTWVPVAIAEDSGPGFVQTPLALNNLEINGGVIDIKPDANGTVQTVNVESMSGTGGTINIATSLENGSANAGSLVVDNVNTSEGTPQLAVNFTGITADDIAGNTEALAALSNKVTAVGATQIQTIAEGSVVGALVQTVNAEGQAEGFDKVVEKENTVTRSLADISALSFLSFRSTMNDVSARMGDLRTTPKTAGSWVRYYGGKMKYGSRDMKNRYNTVQMGADGWIDNFYLGGTFSYTDGNGTLSNGSSDDKTFSFGLYGGWLGDDGQFVDVIVKRHRLKNEFNLYTTAGALSSGNYHTWGTSLSVEYGWRLNCPNTGFFAEPQAELMIGRLNSKSYKTSAGVNVKQDAVNSVVGRAGIAVGYAFPENKGNAYAKASVLHDWKGKLDTTVTNESASRTVRDDLSGTWGEFAIGGAFNPTKNLQTYGEVKTSAGSPIRNPWQVNVGVRYSF